MKLFISTVGRRKPPCEFRDITSGMRILRKSSRRSRRATPDGRRLPAGPRVPGTATPETRRVPVFAPPVVRGPPSPDDTSHDDTAVTLYTQRSYNYKGPQGSGLLLHYPLPVGTPAATSCKRVAAPPPRSTIHASAQLCPTTRQTRGQSWPKMCAERGRASPSEARPLDVHSTGAFRFLILFPIRD